MFVRMLEYAGVYRDVRYYRNKLFQQINKNDSGNYKDAKRRARYVCLDRYM